MLLLYTFEIKIYSVISVFEELSVGRERPNFKLVHKHGRNTVKSACVNCVEIFLFTRN